ncbi:hypothetical protein EB796_022895 [Bugula neritina]|uniref:Vesicle-associated membrane protein 7 n=1 Tax=Bugula neritina TaxID=10212 RepID=A0A7J7IXZ3_BUGNE|nr:hypothetical protein EB796_022895 [Bugula neritina]
MSGVLFCAISRGPTILCCKQRDSSSNFDAVAESMIQNIRTSANTRTTYSGSDQYVFHVVVQGGIIYLCATPTNYRKARAFQFLDEVVQKFTGGSLVVRAGSAGHMELQQDFSNVLNTQMTRFSKEEGDSFTKLQAQVNEVKGVMTENIEKVLQRGERLEDLIDKTTDLEASTNTFKRTTRAVARKYWWQNLKMKIIIGVTVVVVIALIVVVILASTGAFKPKPSQGTPTTTVPPVTHK